MKITTINVDHVKIVLTSESATSNESAKIEIYEKGVLKEEVKAVVKNKKGGDGGLYPCVEFIKH